MSGNGEFDEAHWERLYQGVNIAGPAEYVPRTPEQIAASEQITAMLLGAMRNIHELRVLSESDDENIKRLALSALDVCRVTITPPGQ